MKKTIKFFVLTIISAATLFSCSKKDNASPAKPTSSSSSWSFDGHNYTGAETVFTNNSLLSIVSKDGTDNDGITVNFASRPSTGTYSVVKSYTLSSNQCTIEANGMGSACFSTGSGTVTVKISSGKINASFSDIPITDATNQSNTTISGTLTEQ